ncbi:hypothetical protein CRENBAI_025608 [Crenichthys baileyi]|uniref:Uncharacterized protein n=1 Tax=Crenichthys baileyi TaxID=28760 RepID=A0AAV9RAI3_9TELE
MEKEMNPTVGSILMTHHLHQLQTTALTNCDYGELVSTTSGSILHALYLKGITTKPALMFDIKSSVF